MNIDQIAINLRLRRPWEAVDLGFAMARAWFWQLLGLWLILAVPVFVLAHLVFSVEQIGLAAFVFWWFKPAYEKPMMHYLSRKLFNQNAFYEQPDEQSASKPTPKSLAKHVFNISKTNFFADLLWRRISFSRSFVMPVALLENLSGKARRERIVILTQGQGSVSSWLTIASLHLESFLYFSLFLVVLFLVPENLLNDDISYLFFEQPAWVVYLLEVCYLVAAGIIAPFYVAAGFALYISRRTELEGWDIELEFKKLANAASQSTMRHQQRPATKPVTDTATRRGAGLDAEPDARLNGEITPPKTNVQNTPNGNTKAATTSAATHERGVL